MVLMTKKQLGRIERSHPASLGFSTIPENSVSDDSFLICILSPHHPKSSLLNLNHEQKSNNHRYHQDQQPGEPRTKGEPGTRGEPGRTVFAPQNSNEISRAPGLLSFLGGTCLPTASVEKTQGSVRIALVNGTFPKRKLYGYFQK